MTTASRRQTSGARASSRRREAEVGSRPADAFGRRVLQLVSRIPVGKVVSYGDIAAMAGRPRAAPAVGRLMATAGRPGLPYHRVVSASGQVGGYGGHPALKASLLAAEGLVVRRGRIVNFAACRWTT